MRELEEGLPSLLPFVLAFVFIKKLTRAAGSF